VNQLAKGKIAVFTLEIFTGIYSQSLLFGFSRALLKQDFL
jgi:hypothetical protein